MANLVASQNAGVNAQDSTITADKHTITYRATVPPGTSDDQMTKIVSRLQEKVMNDNNASAMINGRPINTANMGAMAAGTAANKLAANCAGGKG